MRGGVNNRKNLIKLAILGWFSILAVLFAAGAARWFGGITESEDTNEIFNAAAQLPPDMLDAVLWEPDRPNLRREMEPLTRVDVTSAWLRAWEQMSIVAQTGDTTGLEVYFSNSALDGLLNSVADTASLPTHQLGHTLRIDFYSQDGQVIGLSADRVELVRAAEVGDITGWLQTDESYEAILLLEDGNWRIQHWVRRSAEERWWTEPLEAALDGSDLRLNGINYYPRASPFDAFWANYDSDQTAEDFDRISELGMDSVRIFLPFDELGGRWTTEDELAPVLDLLDRADERDLDVVVTLFDGRTDHRTDKWDSDEAHLTTVVEVLRDHPALVMWDLKNEPDRDIGANGVAEQLLYAWLGHVGHTLRELDPQTATTIGWSTAEAALRAPIHTDVLSFHHYGTPQALEELGPQLTAHANGRPLFLSEYGLPTWNSVFPGGHTEAEQAVYFAETLQVTDRLGIQSVMPWTLWDLDMAPTDAGLFPWNTGPQTTMGLLRSDGSLKPAAALVHPDADLEAVQPLGMLHRFTQKTFWRVVAIIGVFFLALWIVGARIRSGKDRPKTKPRQRRTAAEVDALSRHRWSSLMTAAHGPSDDTPDPEPVQTESVVAVRLPSPRRRPQPAAIEPVPEPQPDPEPQPAPEPTLVVTPPPVPEPPLESMLNVLESLSDVRRTPEPPPIPESIVSETPSAILAAVAEPLSTNPDLFGDTSASALPWTELHALHSPKPAMNSGPTAPDAEAEPSQTLWVGNSILDAAELPIDD